MGKLTHTVKGPIASFRSADIAPIESLKLHFLPKQEGSGDPSPTNIRPITGWTGCNGFRCKKNKAKFCQELLDEDREQNGITFHALSDSSVHIEGTATATAYLTRGLFQNDQYLRLLKAGTYTLSSNLPTKVNGVNNGCTLYMYGWDVDGENVGTFAMLNNGVSKKTFTLAKDTYTNIQMGITKDNTFDDDVWVQLSIGQNELDYEDNFEELIPITFPDGQTIYGGYVDLVAGEIVAKYTKKVFNGSEADWAASGDDWNTDNTGFCVPVSEFSHVSYWTDRLISNFLKKSDKYTLSKGRFYIANSSWANFRIRMTESMTLQEFKAFLSQNNLEMVYPLETPIRIPVPAQDIQTFLDYNNFWSDTNDDTEVEYAFADRLSERKLIMDTPHIASASGSVASFNTDLNAPIVDLKAHFNPVQEGSGDPSPNNVRPISGWNGINIAHTKKNLINLGTQSFTRYKRMALDQPIRAGTYTFSTTITSNDTQYQQSIVLFAYNENGGTVWVGGLNRDRRVSKTITFSRDVTHIFIYASIGYDESAGYESTWADMQLECASFMSDYEEYSGEIIPVEFPIIKNLYANDATKIENGTTSSGYARSMYRTGLTNGTFTLSAYPKDPSSLTLITINYGYYSNGVITSIGPFINTSSVTNRTLTISNYEELVLIYTAQNISSFTEQLNKYNIQIERGSSVTDFEPYKTVYGGYVDLLRGKLIAEWKKIILDGSENWSIYGDSYEGYSFRIEQTINDRKLGYQVSKCSMFNNVDGCWGSGHKNDIAMYSDHQTVKSLYFRSPDGVVTTLSEFKQWLSENKPELCYKLAVPIEYDITPQILKTLKGTNNIWSDLNGDVEVKYWTH